MVETRIYHVISGSGVASKNKEKQGNEGGLESWATHLKELRHRRGNGKQGID